MDQHDHDHGHDHDHYHQHERESGVWSEIRHLFAPHSHDAADSVDPALESSTEGIRAVQISLIGLGLTGAAAAEAEGVEYVSTVRARWIGHAIHVEATIVASADLTLGEAHADAERARHAMLHRVPRLNSVTVHVDPSELDGRDYHADLEHHDRSATLGYRRPARITAAADPPR